MEYYSSIKKNEFMKFLGKWMDRDDIILSEGTQSQKSCVLKDFAETTQIWLSLVRLCLGLANTEVDTHSQL